MTEGQKVRRFFKRIKPQLDKATDLPDLFVYFLTVEKGEPFASTKAIADCYHASDLAVPSWLSSHMSNGLKSKPKRFVRRNGGYRLEHTRWEILSSLLEENEPDTQASIALAGLESEAPIGPKRDFLHETISCFSVKAYRAAIVMCWNLVSHHLQDHVISDPGRLLAFNAALTKNNDRRVKISKIEKFDDFTEMPESKFILFCREAKIITGSMFKKLEGRLDDRNTAAHPSGVKVTPKFAEAYIEDLVQNVLVKYVV